MYKFLKLITYVIITTLFILFYTWNNCFCQSTNENDTRESDKIRIAFYNVENLFHPSDDPNTLDESFTPEGDHHWTYTRYKKKLDNIGRCLALLGEFKPPSIIGFAEIENRQVLEDLAKTYWLEKTDYRIIHKDSPDRRGIDVGILYDSKVFTPLHYEMMGIDTSKYHIYTREMIYIKGLLNQTALIHLFAVHWPSRRGGQIGSENRRMMVARMLKDKIQSILKTDSLSNILVMGDFNDNPEDESLSRILNVKPPVDNCWDQALYDLMFPLAAKNEGSYCHIHNFPEWDNLDQIIVSGNLMNGKSRLSVSNRIAAIFREPWLMNEDGTRPFSTYLGPRYLGGFSDHLPVYIDLDIIKNTNQ